MNGRRRSWLLVAAAIAAAGGGTLYESLRSRPPAAPPVASPPPTDPRETERIEGGLTWVATREGRPLFELEADTQTARESGVRFFDDVRRLSLYLEDGRAVEISARRGRVEDRGRLGMVVSLLGEVVVRDPDRLTLETDQLSYDAASRVLRSETPAKVTGPRLRARAGGFTYRPDGRLLEAASGLTVDLLRGRPVRIEAARALYRLSTGELLFDAPFRAGEAGRWLLAGPSTLPLRSESEREPLSLGGPVLAGASTGRGALQLATTALTLHPVAGGERFEAGESGSPAAASYRPDRPEAVPLYLEGGRFAFRTGRSADAAGRQRFEADPWFALRWPGPEGEWRATGARLEAEGPTEGGIESLTATGGVEIEGTQEMGAEGQEARWTRQDEGRLVLTGAPARAHQGRDTVEAPRIVLDRERAELIAEGGALTEIRSAAGSSDALFRRAGGDEPVRVRAGRAVIPRAGRPVQFEQEVQAWQGSTSIRAVRMSIDRERERLVARSDVVLRLERSAQDQPPRTLRLTGDRFAYDAPARRAVVTGNARYEEEEAVVQADEITLRLDEQGNLSRLEAQGGVRLASGPARGKADRLLWEGGDSGTILLVGEGGPAELETPARGVLRARRVRYDLRDETASAESGPGRGTIEAAPEGRVERKEPPP